MPRMPLSPRGRTGRLRGARVVEACAGGGAITVSCVASGTGRRRPRSRQAGRCGKVVLVSSITVETHPHLGPACENLAVEQLLKKSGMAWTILRPTQFASNTLMWAASIRSHETVRAPYADTALPT